MHYVFSLLQFHFSISHVLFFYYNAAIVTVCHLIAFATKAASRNCIKLNVIDTDRLAEAEREKLKAGDFAGGGQRDCPCSRTTLSI